MVGSARCAVRTPQRAVLSPVDCTCRCSMHCADAVCMRGIAPEMVLAAASPAAYKPISTAKILPATIRSYPALANGLLYVRNEKTLVCLNLK